MRSLFVLIVCLAVGGKFAFAELERYVDEWEDYKKLFNKEYVDPIEDAMRMTNYLRTKAILERHNAQKGVEKWSFNKYSDWFIWELETLPPMVARSWSSKGKKKISDDIRAKGEPVWDEID